MRFLDFVSVKNTETTLEMTEKGVISTGIRRFPEFIEGGEWSGEIYLCNSLQRGEEIKLFSLPA